MKYTRIVLMILALALVSVLPVIAQEEKPALEYIYNGTELQQIENGMVVQSWTMPNTIETQRIVAALQAQLRDNDPNIRYEFADNRMYKLEGNQVIGLWELRGGSWVEEPALIVSYEYDGHTVRRFVNDRLQETWTPIIGSYQWVASMQAEANKLIAAHVDEELHTEPIIEHLPALLAKDFTLHNSGIVGEALDMSWYTPEFGESLASVLAVKTDDPVVMAMNDLVVVREPAADYTAFDLMNMPNISFGSPVERFDIYRFEDGKVTDIWLGFDVATLTQGVK
jgi:hypothetical protein